MSTSLRKSLAGRAEIDSRTDRLSPLARRVLILVDGKRDLPALESASGLDLKELIPLVAHLTRLGLVEGAAEGRDADTNLHGEQPVQSQGEDLETTVTLAVDPSKLQAVKQIMLESAAEHLGLLAKPLTEKISGTTTAQELKKLLTKWSMALRESRSGKEHASAYLQRVTELLGAD